MKRLHNIFFQHCSLKIVLLSNYLNTHDLNNHLWILSWHFPKGSSLHMGYLQYPGIPQAQQIQLDNKQPLISKHPLDLCFLLGSSSSISYCTIQLATHIRNMPGGKG